MEKYWIGWGHYQSYWPYVREKEVYSKTITFVKIVPDMTRDMLLILKLKNESGGSHYNLPKGWKNC